MRKLLVSVVLAGAVWTGCGADAGEMFGEGGFFVGCNYWAKNASL